VAACHDAAEARLIDRSLFALAAWQDVEVDFELVLGDGISDETGARLGVLVRALPFGPAVQVRIVRSDQARSAHEWSGVAALAILEPGEAWAAQTGRKLLDALRGRVAELVWGRLTTAIAQPLTVYDYVYEKSTCNTTRRDLPAAFDVMPSAICVAVSPEVVAKLDAATCMGADPAPLKSKKNLLGAMVRRSDLRVALAAEESLGEQLLRQPSAAA